MNTEQRLRQLEILVFRLLQKLEQIEARATATEQSSQKLGMR